LGGIGKTQTAIEYAYRYRDKYQAALWVKAESTLALRAGYAELAQQMHLTHPEDNLEQGVLALKRWLEAHPGWLLILDNADDPAMLSAFLPDARHGHILITSRAQDFQDLGILDSVELGALPVADATAFLLKRGGREEAEAEEREAAEQLARELDGLPLALEQAAAYVKGTTSFRRYLASYRSEGLRRLEARHPALGGYPRSVVSTWAANFEAVEGESPAAADVLRLSALLAPDAIPFQLLSGGASELGPEVREVLGRPDGDPLLIHDLLRPLGRFSLIRIDGDAETYSIHRLVQEVLKAAMDKPTRRQWAERAVRAVNQAFPPVEHDNWHSCGRLLPHAFAVAARVEEGCIEFAGVGLVLNKITSYLNIRNLYTDEPLYQKAVEICRTTLGEHHPAYAESLNNLGFLYYMTDRYPKAESLLQQAMAIRRVCPGEQQSDYAESLSNLAVLYLRTGRRADAEPLYKQAVEICRTTKGEHHPDYAASLNNLGYFYKEAGRNADAEPLYKQAVEICRTALGEQHPDYARSLNNLAELYAAMGRHGEAEPLFLQAMEIRRVALGEHHPDYAASLNNLAGLYRAMGRHAEAEPLRRAKDIGGRASGE
jgi:tetratricopeptide (TPR) repeat protein